MEQILSDAVLSAREISVGKPPWCPNPNECRAMDKREEPAFCVGLYYNTEFEEERVRFCYKLQDEPEPFQFGACLRDWVTLFALLHGAMGELLEYWGRTVNDSE